MSQCKHNTIREYTTDVTTKMKQELLSKKTCGELAHWIIWA